MVGAADDVVEAQTEGDIVEGTGEGDCVAVYLYVVLVETKGRPEWRYRPMVKLTLKKKALHTDWKSIFSCVGSPQYFQAPYASMLKSSHFCA